MYCTYCGSEINEGSTYCNKCGRKLGQAQEFVNTEGWNSKKTKADMLEIARVFGIIVTIISGLAIVPLLWTLPMTIHLNRSIKNNEKTSIAFDVCYLIFVSRIVGILLIVEKEM